MPFISRRLSLVDMSSSQMYRNVCVCVCDCRSLCLSLYQSAYAFLLILSPVTPLHHGCSRLWLQQANEWSSCAGHFWESITEQPATALPCTPTIGPTLAHKDLI